MDDVMSLRIVIDSLDRVFQKICWDKRLPNPISEGSHFQDTDQGGGGLYSTF